MSLRHPGDYLRFVATALLLAVNYGVYLWANNSGHLVEASLGYFINPLVNVLLGMVFLRERLRPAQTAAIVIALLGRRLPDLQLRPAPVDRADPGVHLRHLRAAAQDGASWDRSRG